jgi:ubiquitin carboxyl-terminal hydrolase 4/11/15
VCKKNDFVYHSKACNKIDDSDVRPQEESDSRMGIVGLNNLGNTCYMNSGLQCLSNTPELTRIFLDKKYEGMLNLNNPLGSGGKLIKAYSNMITEMWYGKRSVYSPSRFKSTMASFCPMFEGYGQHDSQELVNFLVH